MLLSNQKNSLPDGAGAPKGRAQPIPTAESHFVLSRPLKGPYPNTSQKVLFGMGCFWGAERKFWQLGDGIWITAAGYAGGLTPNPTYQELCTGKTGHAEVVLVVFEPATVSFEALLKTFWESHDPTQGQRQGNDVGSQYRSAIYSYSDADKKVAEESRTAYGAKLQAAGLDGITTEILPAPEFYFAEADHQQYLAKVPHGYCGIAGTGVVCAG